MTSTAGRPGEPPAEKKLPPKIAYYSYLLDSAERWGPMVEAGGRLYAAVGTAILRLDLASGRWKLLAAPKAHPNVRIRGAAAGKAGVFFCGESRKGKLRRPLLWRFDFKNERLTEMPVAEAIGKAGLGKLNNIRAAVPAAGRLWLAVKACRLVVTKHAGKYWPNGMDAEADRSALWRMRRICLEGLKSPRRWEKETDWLKKNLKDKRLRKELERLLKMKVPAKPAGISN